MSHSVSPLNGRHPWMIWLPREHGAVTVFSFATLISLFLFRGDLAPIAGALLMLWLMMMSLHDQALLFLATVLSTLFMFACGQHLAAGLFLLAFLGLEIMQASTDVDDLWWREIVGLSGAALAPLLITGAISDNLQTVFCAAVALLASILTGLSLIHACRPELRGNPILSAGLSFLLWLSLAALNNRLTIVCLLPYCIQVLWILKRKKLSLKELGLAQAACLGLVSLSILLIY